MPCFPRPLAISLAQPGPPQPQTAPPIFFPRCIHAYVYACHAVRLHPGAAVVVQHRSEAEARPRARMVSAIPPAVVHKRWAARCWLAWPCFIGSARPLSARVDPCCCAASSTIHAMGSTCSPCNAACTQCRSSAVASMVGRSSMGERVVKHETMLAACVCLSAPVRG